MANSGALGLFRFADFLLDKQAGSLHRLLPGGGATPIHVGSRAFHILCVLVESHGLIVPRRRIMDLVWPDVAVEPNNLAVQLSALRRALDKGQSGSSRIQTIPGRGYRFVPRVTDAGLLPTVPAEGRTSPRPENPEFGAKSASIWAAERPRLSLVVLPFHNLSVENITDETVDAIAEDLTSDLGRVYGLFVIGRSSASIFKGRLVNIKQVGEELGVRYAVEGSVRKVASALRVNVRLVSTETGAQLWADRLEAEWDGIGYNIDDIVRPISHMLSLRVVAAESSRSAHERPHDPDATDLLLHAHSLLTQLPTPERLAQRVKLTERAVEVDPTSATALAGLVEALLDSITSFAEDPTVPEKLRRADDLVRRAEALSPNEMRVVFARVYLLGALRRCSELFSVAQRALSIFPNITSTPYWLGISLMFSGKAAEAIPQFEHSIRLNPNNSYVFNRYSSIGYCNLFISKYDEAILHFRRSLAAYPGDGAQHRGGIFAAIAAAQALGGLIDESQSNAAEAIRLWPMLTTRSYFEHNFPKNPTVETQIARMRDALRLVGIRDHADGDMDFGLESDDALHTIYEARTPTNAPGVRTIRTPELVVLLEQRNPLVLDTFPWGKSIPGSIGLWGAGIGGSTSDEYQGRLRNKMQHLTGGDLTVPVVAMGWNAERFQARNLALRLAGLGFSDVYWYRGGREAWQVAGLPEAELGLQNW